jgi:D-beta-D-heptose 7-phosphate kinase/D-beta-D-heptose 1-phosphate adenosyltransferase
VSKIIAVLGDSMLDHYVYGNATRISPEAPVPVIHVNHESFSPGGAAHVAASTQALDFPTVLFTVLGADRDGHNLSFGLDTLHVKCDSVTLSEWFTPVKTRIVAGNTQLLRFDRETLANSSPTYSKFVDNINFKLSALAKDLKSVIVSDYNKGTITEPVVQAVEKLKEQNPNIFIFLDAKPEKFDLWSKVDCITPNFAETCKFLNNKPLKPEEARSDSLCEQLAKELANKIPSLTLAVVTRAQYGCSWYDKSTNTSGSLPAFSTCKSDVIGAGDTFIAALTVGISEGKAITDAIVFANAASALAVSKLGTTVVHRMELDSYLARPCHGSSLAKVMSQNAAIAWAQQLRATHEKVVFANGCFDLLHAGHVHLLEQAKFAGGYLLVGINNDESIQKLKGPGRPFVGVSNRARMVAALECVDAVVVFDEHELIPLIQAVKPEVLVKGSEYVGKDIPGAEFVKNSGGQILLIDMATGLSTTNTAASIKQQS